LKKGVQNSKKKIQNQNQKNQNLYLKLKIKMGCPALGIWVAFLKQPDALPGRAPPKNKNYIFLNYF
jgi:hypothetical protein